MKIGFVHSVIRKDEKLLLRELADRAGVETISIDERKIASMLNGTFGLLLQSLQEMPVIVQPCQIILLRECLELSRCQSFLHQLRGIACKDLQQQHIIHVLVIIAYSVD